ncbi:MAG: NAD+ synthase [Planctomycetes bacterium]|nr:NAD+ synthase [Planctomycetota bacterium]
MARIATAQLDPVVGDIQANLEEIDRAVQAARSEAADVVLTTEMAVLGYPPRDLVLREGVAEACERAVAGLARRHPDLLLLVGAVRRVDRGGRRLANSMAVCRGGRVEAWYDKRLLPTYDVFDEERWFSPGTAPLVVDHAGERLGVLLCEDLWGGRDADARRVYEIDPVAETVRDGATALLVASASPFVLGKRARQRERVCAVAAGHGVPLALCNPCGANDDLIFDGGSSLVDAAGRLADRSPLFESAVRVHDLRGGCRLEREPVRTPERDLIDAMVAGIRGYFRKTGHAKVTLGLSGGIDSALVAALAAIAVGPAAVTGIMMPSRFSSPGSVADAKALAATLGLGRLLELPIRDLHERFAAHLAGGLGRFEGLADENLQSRLRGLTVMAVSNADGSLALATGNKSELAAGYATLYGDMIGALAPIGDLLKTQVYAVCRHLNESHRDFGLSSPPIPESSLTKAPSAELRPHQTDQDSLPPYEDLDRIVQGWIDREQDAATIARETGLPPPLVERWCAAIDRAQFKRDQAPLVLKLSARTFGRGRPMPMAARWRPPA